MKNCQPWKQPRPGALKLIKVGVWETRRNPELE